MGSDRSVTSLGTHCQHVMNYVAEHQYIAKQSLPSVSSLVICGFPRTRTTLLYNLLVCDQSCRASLYIDTDIEVVSPIARSDFIEKKCGNIGFASDCYVYCKNRVDLYML
ncbi:unnamed protein product [Rotaria socialis]|uniref:Uncharacterized protein n=1 Tax=Rotaria socialis TaxID=392032 RepID=A0A818HDG6_9BILA|nr:unnamed protein product [Rotaria socialis]CAF3503078.1 unnamed protein product [Rotaria socialis]CAF3750840.1 unnamed protein product [Rotaria socialis]CAF4136315.1 unnamed protein product [Rotaria socialis]CAF4285427.1 unnamed protein product [Rotaria socialis]